MLRSRFGGFAAAVVAGFTALLLVMGAGVSAGAAGRANPLQIDPNAPVAAYADGQYPQDRDGALTFSDVFPGMQFEREIGWLAATGVSTGWPDGTFLGGSAVSRAAMAAFMYRLAGKPEFAPPADSPFTDVAPGDQFYLPITWLAEEFADCRKSTLSWSGLRPLSANGPWVPTLTPYCPDMVQPAIARGA